MKKFEVGKGSNKLMTNEEVFNQCTIYDNLDEFLKFNNMNKDEFDENLTDSWYLDCTCGTYNGASDTFDPWEINSKNVADSLVNIFNEANWEEELMELEGWTDDSKINRDSILDYVLYDEVFIIKDDRSIYIDRN